MSTEFGFQSRSTSPALQRIIDAGRAFQRSAKPDEANPDSAKARAAAEARDANILARRRRLVERFEKTFQLTRRQRRPVEKTMREIMEEVAAKHRISVTTLLSRRRNRAVVVPRHEAMYRCQRETAHSLVEIGKFFGGFDHTTVLHAMRQHATRLEREAKGLPGGVSG